MIFIDASLANVYRHAAERVLRRHNTVLNTTRATPAATRGRPQQRKIRRITSSVGIPVVRMRAHILRHLFDFFDHTATTTSIFGAEHRLVLATRMLSLSSFVRYRPVWYQMVSVASWSSLRQYTP